MTKKLSEKERKPTDVAARYDEGFLAQMDGRVEAVRTLRQRLGALVSDLGGIASLSYQEQSLCKRIVHLERLIEKREQTLAHGGTVDETVYLNSLNVLSGIFSKLGLKRRAKTLSLKDYLSASKTPESDPARQTSPSQPITEDTHHA